MTDQELRVFCLQLASENLRPLMKAESYSVVSDAKALYAFVKQAEQTTAPAVSRNDDDIPF